MNTNLGRSMSRVPVGPTVSTLVLDTTLSMVLFSCRLKHGRMSWQSLAVGETVLEGPARGWQLAVLLACSVRRNACGEITEGDPVSHASGQGICQISRRVRCLGTRDSRSTV